MRDRSRQKVLMDNAETMLAFNAARYEGGQGVSGKEEERLMKATRDWRNEERAWEGMRNKIS